MKKRFGLFYQLGLQGSRRISTSAQSLHTPLSTFDPELNSIIQKEEERQKKSIILIASENFAPKYVSDALSSVLTNKYSEGYPKQRYYGGNQYIDECEKLCQKRALEAFNLSPKEWGVNVQPLSGCPANFAVYNALLKPHDRILSLDLPHGGHLSHGYQTPKKKISSVSVFYEVLPYRLDESTGLINYPEVEFLAKRYHPKLLIAGASSYSRLIDYKRFRSICDSIDAPLLVDMAHISGLVAAGLIPSPFEHADIVTTTTHKTLRGPRGGMIFYRKGERMNSCSKDTIVCDYEEKINHSVFPGLQGGPHNHTIGAMAVALKAAQTAEYKEYQSQVLKNAKALAKALMDRGVDIVSGGTENHLMLVDLRSQKLSGGKVEKLAEWINISVNKNTLPCDVSAMNPNGIRLGSPAMTSRGLMESDFVTIADFLLRACELGREIQKSSGPKLTDFVSFIENRQPNSLVALRKEVEDFASSFPAITPSQS